MVVSIAEFLYDCDADQVIRMVMVKVEDDDDQVRDGRRRRPGSREHTRHSDDQRSQQDIGKSPSYEKIHSIFTVSVFV